MIPGVDVDALARWMMMQGLGHGPLTDIRLLAGGTQNVILRFTQGERAYILRRPPVHLRANSNETMRREARVLSALSGSKVPHPALIAACEDESVLGAVFYLMEPIEGFTAVNGLQALHAGSPTVRRRMGLSMVEGIAALGALDYRAIGLDGFGKPDGFLERQVPRWRSQLDSYADLPGWTGIDALPDVARIGVWLQDHLPSTYKPGVMHGDYHIANVMFRYDSGDLAAIIDWELCTIGDPLLDLGWMVAIWPEGGSPAPVDFKVEPWDGFPEPADLVAQYGRHSTRDLSKIDWYVSLACYKLGILLEGTHARACAGQASRETGDLLHAQAIGLFQRALGRIG